MSVQRNLLYLLLASFIIRLIIASTIELSNDEVYYYTYALHLQWNYFDHPPGVALLIRLSTLNLWLTNELFVRLGAILCAVAGTWLSYKIGSAIRSERTGWYAAILYNTSIYSGIIAGTFILPDSPQMVCWLASLFILLQIITRFESQQKVPVWHWLLFGLFSGFCTLCKVHGVFLWAGLGLYSLLYNSKILLQLWLYLSFTITLILVSPIIIWNINNHFITYTFHSDRVAIHYFSINISSFLQALFGQWLYNNPINVILIGIALYQLRARYFMAKPVVRILLLTGLPIVLIVTILSLFNPVLPHWSGPGFVTLSFLAAAYLDSIIEASQTRLPMLLKSSVALILTAIVGGIVLIRFYPGTIGSTNESKYGSGDFTLDISGWKNFENQYHQWLQQNAGKGYDHLKIVSNKWFPAAHIEYYVAEPNGTKVIGVGSLTNLHNFAWLNQSGTDLIKGENALCIVPSNYTFNIENDYKNSFASVVRLNSFAGKRSGKTTRFFTLYLLKNYSCTDEAHTITIK